MGSTLTVQNIQGPTSGANANKIIIPSGHTLDASAASLSMPLGNYYLNQVAGNEKDVSSETYNFSHNQLVWASPISNCDVVMTPKSSDSIFMIFISLAWRTASEIPGVSVGIEINGTRATPITGDDALTHWYNGHRIAPTGGSKHTVTNALGIYNAVGSGSHTFKILPYIYNESSSLSVIFNQQGTQLYVMEYAQ